MAETELILPPGVEASVLDSAGGERLEGRGMVVNETDLPDQVVLGAVTDHFEEHSSLLGGNLGNVEFANYRGGRDGSLLARAKFRLPQNIIDEIVLARDLAERDDDVAATLGGMIAVAFSEGMKNVHKDEVTQAMYDEVAKNADLDGRFTEMYRELLIASAVTTAMVFTREEFSFQPQGADRARTRTVSAPLIGVLPAEQIRVIGSDLFGTGQLAYKPAAGAEEKWLREFHSPETSPARKAEMRTENPTLAILTIAEVELSADEQNQYVVSDDPAFGTKGYLLHPRLVHRSTFPKGAWKYPRPLLTRDFSMIEAKRLLNLMDFALLQGGANFLVVAKKGSDARPGKPDEIRNLHQQVRRAGKTGVLVGDHRLEIEIITPKLDELLNPAKRKMLGRKISTGLLRVPDFLEPDQGSQAGTVPPEIVQAVITGDRRILRRHVENNIYEAVRRRNDNIETSAAGIWHPKIILAGTQYFTDYILKMRDRGDISRHSAVAAGGFNYDAEVEQRRRERPDDAIMTPAEVPFSASGGPQDQGGGRPPGSGPDNGAPGARPRQPAAQARPTRVIQRNAGETVRAMYDEENGTYRVGELTYAILDEYAEDRSIGRLTAFEGRALDRIPHERSIMREGVLTVIPVNLDEELSDVKAVRLAPGLSMLVGSRTSDGALMARAFSFREPEFSPLDAEERALRWGYPAHTLELEAPEPGPEPEPEPEPEEVSSTVAPQEIHLHLDGGRTRTRILRDEHDRIIGSEQLPVDDPEDE